jgi:hypothetical protein
VALHELAVNTVEEQVDERELLVLGGVQVH